MFTGFDPYINRLNRIVEQTDTRQEIKRDELKVQAKPEGERKERKPLWNEEDDSMEVSIDAVVALLQGSLSEAQQEANAQADAPPMNVETTHAARAYQNTARFSHESETPVHIAPADPASALTTDEEKRIARFLVDLYNLKQDGIYTLTILRSGSFFDSLELAINTARP